MKYAETTYAVREFELWRPDTRDFTPAFQIESMRTSPSGKVRRNVLATYDNRAAAELVTSALRAAQNDLST